MTGRVAGRNQRALSYDVRFWKVRVYRGKRKTTYSPRWTVAGQEFRETCDSKAHAESRLAELRTAARRGEGFDIVTGLPVSELGQGEDNRTWYEHVSSYAQKRWPKVGGGQRKSIADAIATATPALVTHSRGRPDADTLRRAMYGWTCNMTRRDGPAPPEEIAAAMGWLEASTVQVADLADQRMLDAVLDCLATKSDGTPAANTIARRRSVLYSVLGYAVDEGLLDANPLDRSSWSAPEAVYTVDPDVVINHTQARALLGAVATQGPMGRHLKAFFGCMYYAALRPGETVPLERRALRLPKTGWGEFRLRDSAPLSGAAWSDNGKPRDERQLKHRVKGDVRIVPIAPPLTDLLNAHIAEFGFAPDGRLFRAHRGGMLSDRSTATSGGPPGPPR